VPRQLIAPLTVQDGLFGRPSMNRLHAGEDGVALQPAARCPMMADGVITRDRDEPGLDRRGASKVFEMLVGLQPRLLRDVLGIGRRSDNRQRRAIERQVIAGDELTKRRPIAESNPRDKVEIRHQFSPGRSTLSITMNSRGT
jgi:hypothetical protein